MMMVLQKLGIEMGFVVWNGRPVTESAICHANIGHGQRLWLYIHRNRQGSVQTRTFEPTDKSTDCWSAAHGYNFIIRVK